MKRVIVTLLLMGLICVSLTSCSNDSNMKDAVNMTDEINEAKEISITEKIEEDKIQTENDAGEQRIEIDKQAILDVYENTKADLGQYYYIWDSPKFEIPLLLITDDCVTGEDAKIFGLGSAYNCTVYFADPKDELSVVKIGSMESPSTVYPLACSDDGLFSAFHHYVYQYIPDYEEDKLVLWYGFEDETINNVVEHTKYLEIIDGKMKDVENIDTEQAYATYRAAEVCSFKTTRDQTEPFEIYNLSREFNLEREMNTYCLNLVNDGMYLDFEGDIGDVLSEYKNIDIDGDGKTDKIERFKINEGQGGKTYLLSFSNGSTLHTKAFSSDPDEGEVIELKDLNGDHIDEILFTHYTFSTGGPITWDVYLYYWSDEGKWKSITITDKNNYNLIQDIGDESVLGESYIKSPGVELTDEGLAVLVDYGMKDGPKQTFDLDVFLFDFENGNLSLAEHSAELVKKYWPKNVDGTY